MYGEARRTMGNVGSHAINDDRIQLIEEDPSRKSRRLAIAPTAAQSMFCSRSRFGSSEMSHYGSSGTGLGASPGRHRWRSGRGIYFYLYRSRSIDLSATPISA